MNLFFATAGGLTLITVAAHVFGGTPEFMDPVFASDMPDFNKTGMSVIWDWVTAAMTINAIALFLAAKGSRHSSAIAVIVIAQFLSFGVLFLAHGLSSFGSLLPMPQWIAFGLISALAFWGMRRTAHDTGKADS